MHFCRGEQRDGETGIWGERQTERQRKWQTSRQTDRRTERAEGQNDRRASWDGQTESFKGGESSRGEQTKRQTDEQTESQEEREIQKTEQQIGKSNSRLSRHRPERRIVREAKTPKEAKETNGKGDRHILAYRHTEQTELYTDREASIQRKRTPCLRKERQTDRQTDRPADEQPTYRDTKRWTAGQS